MKENLFLVTLKNPPVTHLVDKYDKIIFQGRVECVNFTQGGLGLVIPVDDKCNIAYIKEITSEEAENIKKRMEERTSEKKIVKPEFTIPGRRGRS